MERPPTDRKRQLQWRRPLALFTMALLLLPALPLPAMEGGPIQGPPAGPRRAPWPGFTNVTASAGLSGLLGDSYAWGDFDDDGDDDLLVKGNRLFSNDGPPDHGFTEVTQAVGIGSARGYAVWGDYNNDGNLDFFCAGQDETQRDSLWRNVGPPTHAFVNASLEAGGMDDGLRPSLAPSWVDYDRDGFLDIYVMNWRDAAGTCYSDVLWHNDGDGTFTDATASAQISDVNPATLAPCAGMGVVSADYNNDGWPDIYACNYLLGPNYLWHNDHDGTFTDLGTVANASGDPDRYWADGSGPYFGHTAGACWGDYDNDGLLDLWVGNLAHKDNDRAGICDDPQLLRNLGFPWKFEDFKERAGMPNIPAGSVKDGQWYDDDTFGGAWCDYDLDGLLDLYVPQVKGYHSWAHSQLWHNDGDGTFTEVGQASGIRIWAGVGCAWSDYDNDGQPDHITEGTYPYQGPREARLFRNEGTSNHYLKVALRGVESNRAAIGARLTAWNGTVLQTREVEGGTGGHAHQNSLVQVFGFGSYQGTVSVEVRWPSGIVQNVTDIPLDRTITITEDTRGPRLLTVFCREGNLTEGQKGTLGCSVSGRVSKFLWDFEGDGRVDAVLGSGDDIKVSYDRSGRYYPSLRVLDSAGTLGEEESFVLEVRNVAPTSRAGGNRTANESEPQVFDGSASEDTPNDRPNLTYNWSFTDGFVSGFSPDPDVTRTFNQSGRISATLCVKDDDGATSNDTIFMDIVNQPPSVAVRMAPLGSEDAPVAFSAAGSDTPNDLAFLRYSWSFGDGTPGSAVSPSPNTTHVYTTAGNYTARVSVADDDRALGQASVEMAISNVPPTGLAELDAVETDEDAALTLTGTGEDTPSDLSGLQYRWDFGDGNATAWGPDRSATHVYILNSTFRAVFHVQDTDGAVATAFTDVTVRNIAPFSSVSTSDVEAEEDAEVAFEGSGRDTPTDQLSLLYQWDFGDENSTDWSPESSASHSYARQGEYRPRLRVRDNDGLVGTSSPVVVSVANAPPVARLRASKASVLEDAEVTFSSEGSTDTPSDIPSLRFEWDFGDGEGAEGFSAVHSYARKKVYRVELEVTDGDGAFSRAEMSLTVKNAEPALTASSDTPRAFVGQGVNFSSAGEDTPSDLRTLRHEWDFGDGSRAQTRNATHAYGLAGKMTVVARVTDDDGASAEVRFDIEVAEPPKPPGGPASSAPLPLAPLAGAVVVAVAVPLVLVLLLKRRARPPPPKRPPGGKAEGPAAPPGRTG